jgi:phage tail-like protein
MCVMTDPVRPSGLPWARLDAHIGWPLAMTLSRGLAGGAEIALGKPGQRPIADAEPLGSFGGRRLPRGLAIAADGRIYVADPAGRVILTASASDGAGPRPAGAPPQWPFVPLWPARPLPPAPAPYDIDPPENPPLDPYTLVRPLALALAPNGDLVIADAGQNGAGRLLVLTLPEGRMRHVLHLVEPVAISVDGYGRACVADAGAGTIIRFDRYWRRETGYPHPSVPRIDGLTHLAHALRDPCGCGCGILCGCEAPAAPEADLWIIARGKIHALTRDGFLWSDGIFAFPGTGPLPVAALPGDARLTPPALTLAADGQLLWKDPAYPVRDPLPLQGLTVDRSGRLMGTAIALLARPRRIELPRSGVAQFLALSRGPLDGEREGFAWDRIALAAEIPEQTRLLVSTATTDAALEEAQIADLPASAWSVPLEINAGDPPEVLVQSPGGRYLWLRIEMFGDGTRTPRIAGIDIFAPRRSSLADLPAPFREDPESAAFLDRFLSYFDTVLAETAARQASIPALFDPEAVPAGPLLAWLASWFDIEFLPEWPEATRRAMVAKAIDMYRRRSTVSGLRQMVQWHTGLAEPAPAIIEHFRITAPIFIGGSLLAPTAAAHAFTIVVPAVASPDDTARDRLDRVIAAAIPAHTRYELRLVEPGITIGRQSTLGIDMLIGSSRPHPLGDAKLGQDAMLPAGRGPLILVPDQGEPCSC